MIEALATAFFAWRSRGTSFNVAGLFLGPLFVAPQKPPFPLAGQRFLGDVTPSCPAVRQIEPGDALLSTRMGKNIAATTEDGWGWLVTNSQGFVSTGEGDFFYQPNKPKGTFRVIVLGGSTVRGVGVDLPSQSFPAQLKRAIEQSGQAAVGQKLEVINAGVPGYYSTSELSYLKSELLRYDPDLVIAYDGWNDYIAWIQTALAGSELESPPALVKTAALSEEINDSYTLSGALGDLGRDLRARLTCIGTSILHRSAALTLLQRRGWDGPRSRRGWSQTFAYSAEKLRSLEPVLATLPPEKVSSVLEDNWNEMAYVSRRRHFRLAIFLQPIMGVDEKPPVGDYETWMANVMKAQLPSRRIFYAAARRSLERVGDEYPICSGDLSSAFSGTQKELYYDSGHLLEEGNRIIAQAMAERLAACNSLRPNTR